MDKALMKAAKVACSTSNQCATRPNTWKHKTLETNTKWRATALDHIIRVGFHEFNVLGDRPPLNKYKDKLWIFLRLQMEHYFSETTFQTPKSHIDNVANKVWMDIGLAFLIEAFNELKKEVAELAREDWAARRTSHQNTH
ncbi:hypothetical protein PIB30_049468 [Stylosanthes scabra]|uniref:Uncharacterized protein n=1 Tax=Stylosanthes scabra TaxID=79078 RepID=A0ABU6YER8_9FABA|nr:hypothetical protein [Stylosanthes scabra]